MAAALSPGQLHQVARASQQLSQQPEPQAPTVQSGARWLYPPPLRACVAESCRLAVAPFDACGATPAAGLLSRMMVVGGRTPNKILFARASGRVWMLDFFPQVGLCLAT